MDYTRQKYIRGAPPPKITIFEMGTPSLDCNYEVSLNAKSKFEISSGSLESIRVNVNRVLTEKLSSKYYFKIPVYPHIIVRKSKQLAFAGADRISKGMRLSFGKPKFRTVRVKRGQTIAFVRVIERDDVEVVRKAFKRVLPKIPGDKNITVKTLKKLEPAT
ncbi:MAG: 50S ribosomal protein L16 [Candidatus Bathyarchaeota archaeon]|nr:50S ribosomal protein L16 [Candidatus Bathyarchaeota archaeon]